MLMCEHFPELADWDVKIVGTDISRQVVEYAQRGRYRRLEVNRGLPARMLVKYLGRDMASGRSRRGCARCASSSANLGPLPALAGLRPGAAAQCAAVLPAAGPWPACWRSARQMAPGGYLLLGAAEQAEDSTELFKAEFAGMLFLPAC